MHIMHILEMMKQKLAEIKRYPNYLGFRPGEVVCIVESQRNKKTKEVVDVFVFVITSGHLLGHMHPIGAPFLT